MLRVLAALLLACGLAASLQVERQGLSLTAQVRPACSEGGKRLTNLPATQPTEQCITAAGAGGGALCCANCGRAAGVWPAVSAPVAQATHGGTALAFLFERAWPAAGALPLLAQRQPTLLRRACRFRGCPRRSLAVLLLDGTQLAERVLSRRVAAALAVWQPPLLLSWW